MFYRMRLLLITVLFFAVSAAAVRAQAVSPTPPANQTDQVSGPSRAPVRNTDGEFPDVDLNIVVPNKFGDLEGTEWIETNSPDNWITTYRLDAGGILSYRNRGGSYKNGTWWREGNKVFMETNKKYCEYELTLTGNRDIIQASAHNKAGSIWTFTLLRYQKPE